MKMKNKKDQNVDMLVYLFMLFSCTTPFSTSDCLCMCMYMNVIYQKLLKKRKMNEERSKNRYCDLTCIIIFLLTFSYFLFFITILDETKVLKTNITIKDLYKHNFATIYTLVVQQSALANHVFVLFFFLSV